MRAHAFFAPALAFLLAAAPAAGAQEVNVSVGGVGVGVTLGDSDTGGALPGSAALPPSSEGTPAAPQQEQALQAVRGDRALPLDQILKSATAHTSGEVIDAKLVTLQGFLLYELKILEPTGDVTDLYFYARSGKIVRTD